MEGKNENVQTAQSRGSRGVCRVRTQRLTEEERGVERRRAGLTRGRVEVGDRARRRGGGERAP